MDAFKAYNSALDHLSLSDNSDTLMRLKLWKNKGDILTYYKHFDDAIHATQQALKYAELLEDNRRIAGVLYNLGNILHHNQEYDQSIAFFSKSYQLNKKLVNINNIGAGYLGKQDYDLAFQYFERVIEQSDNSATIAKAYHNMALCMDRSGQPGAEQYFIKALEMKQGKDKVRTLREYGRYAMNNNQIKQSIDLLHQAEALLPELPYDPEYNEVHHLLDRAYTISQDMDNALSYSDSYFAVNNEFLTEQKQIREKELQFQLMMAQREYEMEKKLATTIAWYEQKITYQIAISLLLMGYILGMIFWWYRKKRQVEREIKAIPPISF